MALRCQVPTFYQRVLAHSLLVFVCLLFGGCSELQPADVAIRGTAVVDVEHGAVLVGQTVLVRGNRIVAVGPDDAIQASPATAVVEAEGKFLIPGLWDMHVHSVRDVGPDDFGSSIPNHTWHLPLLLAHGVTGVRNMNDAAADATLGLSNSVKRRLAVGELVGPRLLISGLVDGDPPLGTNPIVVRNEAEARAVVRQFASHGADLVKVYENLSREAYFAILDEARRQGIPVDGHVPFRVTHEEAAAAGQRTVEHPEALAAMCADKADVVRERFSLVLDDYLDLPESEQFLVQFRIYSALYDIRNEPTCRSSFDTYRESGIAVTVDLVPYHHVVHADEILGDSARMDLVPEMVRRAWENWFDSEAAREFQAILQPIIRLELDNVHLAQEMGVTLLAGTDVGVPLQVPGISLHVELERLVEAGLSPLEAIQAATLNPARVLSMSDSVGTVAAGKLADLVLLDANPLDDIRNTRLIHAVVADGRLFRRAELDRLIANAKASYDDLKEHQ